MGINSKLVKLASGYPDNKVVFNSVMKNGKSYRKKYNSTSEMISDRSNPRLNDTIDLITINRSLFDQDPMFVMVFAHEGSD